MTKAGAAAVLLVIFAASTAQAQTRVVKQRLKDGSVLYSDQKVAGATVEGVIDSPALPIAPTQAQVPSVLPKLPPLPPSALPSLPPLPLPGSTALRQSVQDGSETRKQLTRALEEALARQVDGAALQAGDRIGTAKGKSRFSDAYKKRQANLAKDVSEAKAALEAYR